ncbi:MAG TPA: M20/M25/M40 family metallo-hydrolase [Bacteroidales bacterium]|nr:M20/M25/M40 family metallo-hydrolase [Bacteroidales bacterium]
MILRVKRPVLILLFVCLTVLISSCNRFERVTQYELRNHIKYLSSDSLKGRLTGTAGDSLAAEYIRKDLASNGLVPLIDDGWQRFTVTKNVKTGKKNVLRIDDFNYMAGLDFQPMAFSSNDSLEAEVVFAGYGFNIDNDSVKWNDYKDIDVKGKWVLILRADPEPDKMLSPFQSFNTDRGKAMVAKDLGASGVLLVSGSNYDPEDKIESLSEEGFSVGLPAFRIKRDIANIILTHTHRNIDSVEKQLNTGRKPITFNTKAVVKGNADLVRETAPTRNVAMVLRSDDPELSDEYLVIGAHFDHLGMGGSGSRNPDTVAVHHGADDNASGVAMMLELAEKFAINENSHRRSVVCLAFSGEEEGLLGSKYFTDNPPIDLSKVNAMINLDMLGRLNEDKTLQISGVGTAAGLKDLVLTLTDTSEIKISLSEQGYGPSDHSSFYGKNIPVLFYFTGAHEDYHTPKDTYDAINYDGMVKISDLLYSVGSSLANADSTLSFREAGPKTPTAGRVRGITLGIMPDFAGVIKNGLRADFVTPGKPADLGGMKKGDIIVAIEGKPVNNIEDYMYRMNQLKRGQKITVDVLRNGKKLGLLIQL